LLTRFFLTNHGDNGDFHYELKFLRNSSKIHPQLHVLQMGLK
jgi:hypothetical protein